MNTRTASISRNIALLYVIHFFLGLMFYYGIERLFLFSLGISPSGASATIALGAATVLLLDIPLGALADRWGRKHTLLTACFFLLIATGIFAGAHSLEMFMLGTFFYSLYLVGTSGTMQALVYDSLAEMKMENQYNKISGRMYALFGASIGIALYVSGVLAQTMGYRFNFQISLVSGLIALALTAFLREPNYHDPEHDKLSAVHHLKQVIAVIHKNKIVLHAGILLLSLELFVWMSNEYSQFIFHSFGLPLWVIGIISGTALMAGVIGRLLAHRLEHRLYLFALVNLALFSLIGWTPELVVITSLIIFFGTNSLMLNNMEAVAQAQLPSKLRATAMSVLSSIGSGIAVIIGVIITVALKYTTIFVVFRGIAVLGAICTLYWLIVSRKEKRVRLADDAEDFFEGSFTR